MARGAVRKAVRCGGFSECCRRVGQKSKKIAKNEKKVQKGKTTKVKGRQAKIVFHIINKI